MDLPFLEELSQEEGRFKKFRISSGGPARVSGDLDKGFAINIDSTLGEGACCLEEDCASLTESDCYGQNGVYMGEGVPCDPNPCSETPTGACCAEDGSCTIETEEDCTDSGGTYQGDDTTCEDVDCTQGACCDGEDCTITTEEECTGVYQGDGTTCDPNPCPQPTGACCVDGDCSVTTEEDCTGVYLGDGTNCDDPLRCACPCGFEAFDGSGRRFLRYHRTISATSSRHEQNNCDPPDNSDVTVDADGSATFEQHYEDDGFGGCNLITDTDESSSNATITLNGSEIFSCHEASMACFCNVTPEGNLCISWIAGYQDCNACFSGGCGSDDTDTTAITRTRTVIFCVDCSEAGCTSCPDCEDTCTVSGQYILTETLSEECVPV